MNDRPPGRSRDKDYKSLGFYAHRTLSPAEIKQSIRDCRRVVYPELTADQYAEWYSRRYGISRAAVLAELQAMDAEK